MQEPNNNFLIFFIKKLQASWSFLSIRTEKDA